MRSFSLFLFCIFPHPRSTSAWWYNTNSLQEAVTAWCTDPSSAEAEHGHISDWDTSGVEDMSSLFERSDWGGHCSTATTFDDDISRWDGEDFLWYYFSTISLRFITAFHSFFFLFILMNIHHIAPSKFPVFEVCEKCFTELLLSTATSLNGTVSYRSLLPIHSLLIDIDNFDDYSCAQHRV